MTIFNDLYHDYPEMPYISKDRDLEEIRLSPKVPKRNMQRTQEGLLPGHIILLWRINFGTFTTETPFSKYFEYSYGIEAQKELDHLITEGYVVIDSAQDSLAHLPASRLKVFLKERGLKGLSKMKRSDVDKAIKQSFSEEELGRLFSIRGLSLTIKGQKALTNHPEIIAKHPQKKF
ncbi:hypothetical protein [Streptococcus sp. zg-JUN1979]|uniref:hypothetical protein n=1 Tax=Streptococcus sp. zg-JUN1979 TaxID=3391450 RepID=UPI0039A6801C